MADLGMGAWPPRCPGPYSSSKREPATQSNSPHVGGYGEQNAPATQLLSAGAVRLSLPLRLLGLLGGGRIRCMLSPLARPAYRMCCCSNWSCSSLTDSARRSCSTCGEEAAASPLGPVSTVTNAEQMIPWTGVVSVVKKPTVPRVGKKGRSSSTDVGGSITGRAADTTGVTSAWPSSRNGQKIYGKAVRCVFLLGPTAL
jgi:hypothetical protein